MSNILEEMLKTENGFKEVTRLVVATYILGQMMDTPTHGLTGQASKMAKVEAAFDYADLLMKG